MDSWQRQLLRQQAMSAWEDAKRLKKEAVSLTAKAQDLLEAGRERRSARQLEALVDWSIRRTAVSDIGLATVRPGAGLVASANVPTVTWIEDMARQRLGLVVGAQDAGTALGLAIASQPDIAIVDERLDLGKGSDLVLVLPIYAPRTKALLLTDDREAAARVRLVGMEAMPRGFSERELSAWLEAAAA